MATAKVKLPQSLQPGAGSAGLGRAPRGGAPGGGLSREDPLPRIAAGARSRGARGGWAWSARAPGLYKRAHAARHAAWAGAGGVAATAAPAAPAAGAAHPAHPAPPRPCAVEDLLLWRDVPRSAAVLGGITVAYLLLEVRPARRTAPAPRAAPVRAQAPRGARAPRCVGRRRRPLRRPSNTGIGPRLGNAAFLVPAP
jgi:hypothetical protein